MNLYSEMDNKVISDMKVILKTGNIDYKQYEAFLINDNKIHVSVDNDADLSKVKLLLPQNVTAQNDSVIVRSGETNLDLSDFCKPLYLKFSNNYGDTAKMELVVYNLPVVTLDTPDGEPIISRDERTEDCVVRLIEGGAVFDLGSADIKSRGGSTWKQDKKPYNIKFKKKQALLDMSKSKHWILLANAYYDRTQLHNDVAFEMARMTDYPWVQRGTFVEVLLNGEHRGIYYLCEKIGEEKNKLNIDIVKETDIEGDAITGGYLLEMSEKPYVDPNSFSTSYFNITGKDSRTYGWKLKKPEDNVPEIQFNYIVKALNYMESLLWNEDSLKTGKYREYLDIETAINWWLVEEATLNEEASRSKNAYLYKLRGDNRFRLGPPWDFDAWTFGLYGVKTFYCTETTLWYRQLFKDSVFVNRVKEKWNVYYPKWKSEIPQYIEKRYEMIKKSAERNETLLWTKWHKLNQYPDKSYREMVDKMRENFLIQLDWMNEKISNM